MVKTMISTDDIKNLNTNDFRQATFDSSVAYDEKFELVLRNHSTLNQWNLKSLHAQKTVDILLLMTNIVIREYDINGTPDYNYYIRDYSGRTYNLLTENELSKYLNLIYNALDCRGCDPTRLYKPVIAILKGKNKKRTNFINYNQPPRHLKLFKNGIFDLKSKQFFESNSKEYNDIISKYHYIIKPTDSYIAPNKQNKTKRDLGKLLLKSLANGDEGIHTLLSQLCFSVIEGNGRERYFILSGQAGAGKSTFGNLLYSLAGKGHTITMNLDSISDPNAINNISSSTKLVLGDDLAKNTKLNRTGVQNYKTLIAGNAISVPVKYEPNRIVQTDGAFVQMANDDPTFYEANDAIKDRTVLIPIKGKNYRHERKLDEAVAEVSRRLDKYIRPLGNCDQEFIDEFISEIIDTVDYFEDYTIPKEVETRTADMINDGSWANQFIEDAKNRGLFNFSTIPASHIAKFVKSYLRENNSGMICPSTQTITKDIEASMNKLGYKLSPKDKLFRISSITPLEYNPKFIKEELYDDVSLSKSPSRCWIKDYMEISDKDVSDFLDSFMSKNYSDCTQKEKIITRFCIDMMNDEVLAWYQATDI